MSDAAWLGRRGPALVTPAVALFNTSQLELGLTVCPSFALNGGQDLEKVLVYFCRYVVNGKRVVLSTVSTQPGLHSCHSLPNVTIMPHASVIVSPTKCG